MTSRERINAILKSEPADRMGILDLDIEFYYEEDPSQIPSPPKGEKVRVRGDKFFLFAFNGPFQNMSSVYGLEETLTKFVQEPGHSVLSFKESQKQIIKEFKRLKDKGFEFDGVWMGEDIAYNKGLYFSIEKYRKELLGIHKDLSDFFSSEGLPLFFHCDGNVEGLLPCLAAAKIKAIHPVQELGNPNLLRLKREFSGHITFAGGVGLHRLKQERGELLEYIQRLSERGNYIFSFDGPIPDNFSKEEYNKLIRGIERNSYI